MPHKAAGSPNARLISKTVFKNRWCDWPGVFSGSDSDGGQEDPIARDPAQKNPGPVDRLEQKEVMAALEEMLQELSLRPQQVFLLRICQGMGINETAEVRA